MVESEPGEGSTFSFSLPINNISNSEAEKLNIYTLVRHLKQSFVETTPSETPRNKNILVVDDNAILPNQLTWKNCSQKFKYFYLKEDPQPCQNLKI